jgi:predicted secreted protein
MRKIGEDASGTEVTFPVGDTFEVALGETRTAGFQWCFVKEGEPVCELLSESSDSPSGAAGGSGTHHWQFRIAIQGAAEILLHHRRPWEADAEPGRVFQLKVRAQ